MCKKHQSVFDEHMGYVNNDTPKPFKMGILHNDEHIREMFEMERKLSTPRDKNEEYQKSDWDTRDKYFDEDEIHKAIEDSLSSVTKK